MHTRKHNNLVKVWDRGAVSHSRVVKTLPDDLIDELAGRQLGRVCELVEAAYLDGYKAAGGNTADIIEHCDHHRRRL